MSLSHLGRALAAISSVMNTTALAIARNAGISHVILSRAANGSRMEAKTLRAVVLGQPDRRIGLDLLIAHLRDEIERAGVGEHEVAVSTDGRAVESDMRLLAEECLQDPQLAALLREMAALVRARPLVSEASAERNALAGESGPESLGEQKIKAAAMQTLREEQATADARKAGATRKSRK